MSPKVYPTPLVIPPLGTEHTHTVIALHGRGSNANRFGHELLASASLQIRLPTVRFVFPTASKRRATKFKKMPINQWFDNCSLDYPGERTDLQVEGLCETAEFLRGLINEETRILDEGSHRKIIVWGLSQGCAAGIFTLLGGLCGTSEPTTIGAFVGMSGWLPFEQQLHEILRCDDMQAPAPASTSLSASGSTWDTEDGDTFQREPSSETGSDSDTDTDCSADDDADALSEPDFDDNPCRGDNSSHDDFDPFAEDEEDLPLLIHAINHVRDILELPMISVDEHASKETPLSSCCHLQVPVFIGHGSEDEKVSVELGKKMSHVLSDGFQMDVTWKVYEGLGHWYRVDDEIEDILSFLQDQLGLPVKPLVECDQDE